jgi:peptidoglycan-associated lipoprotein
LVAGFRSIDGLARSRDSTKEGQVTAKVANLWHMMLFVAVSFLLSACHKSVAVTPFAAAPPPTPTPVSSPLPPTIALAADRPTINAGESVTLRWQSTRAASVSIDNSIGSVELNGNKQVRPQTSTSYIALARGDGGTATSSAVRVVVNVVPPANRPSVARPTPTRTVPVAEQFQTIMQDVLFDYDKSTIRPTAMDQLQSEAQWLVKNPSVHIVIEGNADERGGQEYNIALGDERAAAVRKLLLSRGVLESRMETVSYGEERPLCREESENCWQRNRRAHFTMKTSGNP